jgi:hypothetical protein
MNRSLVVMAGGGQHSLSAPWFLGSDWMFWAQKALGMGGLDLCCTAREEMQQ